MRILLLIIICAFTNEVYSQLLHDNESIYNKEVVYCYNVKHIDSANLLSEGVLYLVCYGTPWKLDSLKQVKVNWAYNYDGIFEKTVGTGVIENSTRTWMHPPRQDKFSILEYSPFPYVRNPVEIGNKWSWKLSLGKYWENKELGVLSEDIMEYEYHIETECDLDVNFQSKMVHCYKIVANSTNPKFKSRLESYYNHKYGFIELKYINIDKTEMHFKLIDVSSRNKFIYSNSYFAN